MKEGMSSSISESGCDALRAASSGSEPSARVRVLDLFSGIGAYSLGLERTGGFQTVAFAEINAFCRRNLNQHWPHVPTYEDVKLVTGAGLRAAGIVPDWIVAGWPCQGNSPAGTGLGMDDPRSGLWSEIRRLAGDVRPRGLLLENSSNLLNINGGADFGRVLGDLAALGFDAEWHCLPAAAFDAPHIRDRVWIIATRPDPEIERCDEGRLSVRARAQEPVSGVAHQDGVDADADGSRLAQRAADAGGVGRTRTEHSRRAAERMGPLSDPAGLRRRPRRAEPAGEQGRPVAYRDSAFANAHSLAPVGTAIARQERVSWEPEPDVVRVVHGAADRVERVHALGNLNPPIIPESIGRAILAAFPALQAAA